MSHIQTLASLVRDYGFGTLFRRIILWLRGIRRYAGSYSENVYRAYLQYSEPRQRKELDDEQGLCLTLITAMDERAPSLCTETYRSLRRQGYTNWEWIIIAGSVAPLPKVIPAEPRIKLLEQAPGNHVSLLNAGLQHISGDYFILVEAGDSLAPHALSVIARRLHQNPKIDILYSDMDLINPDGQRHSPLFRPDWSPELMLSTNLLESLAAFRNVFVKTVGKLDPDAPTCYAWEYALRTLTLEPQICHIAQILYHRNDANVVTVDDDELQRVLTNHLIASGHRQPHVRIQHPTSSQLKSVITWEIPDFPLISIVIPSRDQHKLLGECLASIYELTSYPNYEVIVVDTGSVEPETATLYQYYQSMPRFRTISFTGAEFNFSEVCNQGARASNGTLLLFLNNDTKIIQSDWLNRLAQWFEDDHIGIAGPRLLYRDGTIQHAGVIVGLVGLAGHLFRGATPGQWTIFGSDQWYRNLQAVTGACLMISRTAFEQAQGFDEGFSLNFSDVDLCLRVHANGYRVLYTPDVELIHYEAISHKAQIPRKDFERANMLWRHWLQAGDPYFNSNLSYRRASPFPAFDTSDSSFSVNREMMRKLPHQAIISLASERPRI